VLITLLLKCDDYLKHCHWGSTP